MKQRLIKSGMPEDKAKGMAQAHTRFNSPPPKLAPERARVDSFQLMGDSFRLIQKRPQQAQSSA